MFVWPEKFGPKKRLRRPPESSEGFCGSFNRAMERPPGFQVAEGINQTGAIFHAVTVSTPTDCEECGVGEFLVRFRLDDDLPIRARGYMDADPTR
jgi:hypothetical protein